jgi:metal transporter CNNM
MALLISVFLILFAGLCSGLTVGYLSIKKQNLMIWLDSSDEYKIKVAKTILGVLENHHLLLSTLLLSNALAMEALPIFLDKIVPAFAAILISTVSVLIFGEVIPQAYCTGSHQIPIAYYTWLGHHEDKIVLDKSNLKTLLQLHKSKEFGYTPEEIELLQNTLDLRSKKV